MIQMLEVGQEVAVTATGNYLDLRGNITRRLTESFLMLNLKAYRVNFSENEWSWFSYNDLHPLSPLELLAECSDIE